MARLGSAFALGMLILTSTGAAAAPGDLASDFLPFGTGGRIERVGMSGLTGDVVLDTLGRVIVAGTKDAQFAVQRRSGPRFGLVESRSITVIPGASSTGRAVAVAPDGKIVVAGTVYYNNTSDFGVARLNADFTPDATFGAGGTTFVDFDGNRDDSTWAVAVQADRKVVVVGGGYNDTGFVGAVIRLNEDGSLDSSFDGNGKKAVNTIFGFTDVVIQDDGRIVMSGDDQDVGDGDFGVVRLNPNGTPDASFDGDGLLFTGFGDNEVTTALKIDPEGRIVVAGFHRVPHRIHVARYLPANGMLDPTFDGDGRLTDTFASEPRDMAVQPDGKIVILGTVVESGLSSPFFLTRYNVDGTVDSTFGDNGQVRTSFAAGTSPSALAAAGDGTLVAFGEVHTAPAEAALVRYRSDGSLDAGGVATLAFARRHLGSEATALTVSNGSLVAAGKVYRDDYDMALARLVPGGSGLDATFGVEPGLRSGAVVYGLGLQNEEIRAVATQADGEVVVAGEVNSPSNGQNFLVGRFNAGGDYDLACSFVGFTSVHFDTGDDVANAVDVAEDDRIYAAGTVRGPTGDDFGAVRLTTACRVDIAGGGGATAPVEYKPRRDLGGQERCAGLLRQGGRVVLAGSSGTNIALMRLATPSFLTGSIRTDTSFGDDGQATLDTGYTETASGLRAQPDGRLIVSGTVDRGGTSDFLVTRFSADGDPDLGFGVNGVAFADFNALDVATGLAVRGDGTIAVGGYTTGPSGTEFAVAQFTPDGQPDLAFSGDGRATVRVASAAENVAHAVTFLGGNRVVLGGYAMLAGARQFALAALETTRDVTVPTTTTSTSTTLAPGETTSTTTEVSGPTSTTVQPIPGPEEICGNCEDDDGDGLVDFEDPACCPAGAAAMTLRKLGIGAGRKGTTLAFAARLAKSGVAAGTTATQDVVLQVAAAGRQLLCARVPAANLTRRKSRLKFRDAAHMVVSAGGLERLRLRAKKDGSGAVAAGGKQMPFAVPAAGAAVVTLGLRDPALAEGGNRCARAQATLEVSGKGALRLPR